MEHYENILLESNGAVAVLTLAREEVHNAMNIVMIRELTQAFESLNRRDEIRIILLRAKGEHFSAGADLNWMRAGTEQSREQLLAESRELATLFRHIQRSDHVVVAAVQGKVMGGANGLVAASDIVVAEENAWFAFSEVRLGLIPATIAPYVLRKIGYSRTAEWMLTGRLFDAREALGAGLVHVVSAEGRLKETAHALIRDLLSNGPAAMKGVKSMLNTLEKQDDPDRIIEYTAELIAGYRTSEEGQEGINAFFEKRRPGWYETY